MNNFQGRYEDEVAQEYLDGVDLVFGLHSGQNRTKGQKILGKMQKMQKMQKMEVWNSENPCSHMV